MKIGSRTTVFSLTRYKFVTFMMTGLTVLVLLAAALPSLHLIKALPDSVKNFSRSLSFLPIITVDTDPENMLSASEPVRVFHDEMKKRMDLHDMVVVGVINEHDPNGVFNPSSLKKIYELTVFAQGLQFDASGDSRSHVGEEPAVEGLDDEPDGIIGLDLPEESADVPATNDEFENFEKPHGVITNDVISPSTVDSISPVNSAIVFKKLMPEPPQTQLQANIIRAQAQRIPFLNGTMVSEDGKAIAIYLPLTEKKFSYQVYRKLQEKIAEFGKGPEEFHITGLPVAEDTFGVEMFIQMAISAPAAMIVIFVLMLLFFRKLIVVLSPMIVAMVSVILTMGALILCGFPIHIMSSMIPIFIMPIAVLDSIHIISDFFEKYQLTRDRKKTMTAVMDELFTPMLYTSLTSAAGFASLALTPIPPVQVFGIFVAIGIMIAWLLTIIFIPAFVMFIAPKRLENFGSSHHNDTSNPKGWLGKFLHWTGAIAYGKARAILALAVVIMIISGYGISKIVINDNPVKWFAKSHPIRVADKVLNEHFGGTYMAYLSMEYDTGDHQEVFKRPDVLRWQVKLQQALAKSGVVGKSTSLADIVKTIHRDLLAKDVDDPKIEEYYRIPDTSGIVSECLVQIDSSHRPQDLTHFVTVSGPGAYQTASIWVQLTSGDNKDMEKVIAAANEFLAANPAPVELKTKWFGLTYINTVWQSKMVGGMINAFAGSFLVVFLLMTILFRSALWGLLCMIPLTVTIVAIYGAVGFAGKDYDMPVAILSSLTLGLAVDFAIHFLVRARQIHKHRKTWKDTSPHMFGEPARAIGRNIIVIAAGFTPLLLAPLMPYRTVGILLAAILLVSGVATLLLLPALIRVIEKRAFRQKSTNSPAWCEHSLCMAVSVAVISLIAMNVQPHFGWNATIAGAIIAIVVLAILFGLLSRSAKCRVAKTQTIDEEKNS